MKHDIESYKKTLFEIWKMHQELSGDEVINGITNLRNCTIEGARKILAFCRRKNLVTAKHAYSHTFYYRLNF